MNFIADYGLILILFFILVVFALQPLFYLPFSEMENSVNIKEELERRKQVLYRQIKELEMDLSSGNLDEDDFRNNRQEMKQEVSKVISQLNDLKNKRA